MADSIPTAGGADYTQSAATRYHIRQIATRALMQNTVSNLWAAILQDHFPRPLRWVIDQRSNIATAGDTDCTDIVVMRVAEVFSRGYNATHVVVHCKGSRYEDQQWAWEDGLLAIEHHLFLARQYEQAAVMRFGVVAIGLRVCFYYWPAAASGDRRPERGRRQVRYVFDEGRLHVQDDRARIMEALECMAVGTIPGVRFPPIRLAPPDR